MTRGDFGIFVDRARYRTEARRDPGYGCNVVGQARRSRRNSFRWNRPGFDQTDRHPVTCVSVRDAIAYARWLSQETGHRYRLPGAAEWQYAERAGSPAAMLHIDRGSQEPPGVCRYAHRGDCFTDDVLWSDGYTMEVGTLLPMGIGLHDMKGNVEELLLSCLDPESPDQDFSFLYSSTHGSPDDVQDCEYIRAEGVSWYGDPATALRAHPSYKRDGNLEYYRRNSTNYTGFRIIRELADPSGVQ